MSSSDEPAAALPLFHKRIVALDPTAHAALKLDRSPLYGHSAGAEVIPIGLAEFEPAAHSYPILFADSATPLPVVILGVRKGWNLFVDEGGAWMPGAYVPALVRAYPFVLMRGGRSDARWVGIEADAACLGTATGVPLFEDGKPAPIVNEAAAFCQACQAELDEAAAFAEALARAGVLAPHEATITAAAGRGARITGFQTVDPQKLAAVPVNVFLGWRERNWIAPIYAHLFSAGNWRAFTELATSVLATRQ